MHAAAQFNTLQPVQMNSVRSIRPQLAQGHGQSVLARVALPSLRSIQRGSDGALLDQLAGRRMSSQWARVLDVQGAADRRAQRRVRLARLRRVQLKFRRVADARREAEASSASGQDVISEAGRVGVVLLRSAIGLDGTAGRREAHEWNRGRRHSPRGC